LKEEEEEEEERQQIIFNIHSHQKTLFAIYEQIELLYNFDCK
jgi:hypothetical protein